MNSNDYKNAKIRLGMKNPDLWCNILRIAKDTDKSYSCGRLAIPDHIADKVQQILKSREMRVAKLVAKLQLLFEGYTISTGSASNDIYVISKEQSKLVTFVNNGVDHFFCDVYSFVSKGNVTSLILYYPTKPWEKEPNEFDWYLWRTESRLEGANYMHNYHNEITKELIFNCLGIHVQNGG